MYDFVSSILPLNKQIFFVTLSPLVSTNEPTSCWHVPLWCLLLAAWRIDHVQTCVERIQCWFGSQSSRSHSPLFQPRAALACQFKLSFLRKPSDLRHIFQESWAEGWRQRHQGSWGVGPGWPQDGPVMNLDTLVITWWRKDLRGRRRRNLTLICQGSAVPGRCRGEWVQLGWLSSRHWLISSIDIVSRPCCQKQAVQGHMSTRRGKEVVEKTFVCLLAKKITHS